MIHVSFPPQTDIAWDQWVTRCEHERDRLIAEVASGNAGSIKRALYTAQRRRYLALTSGKCAYCESPIAGTQDGDVEHFRPKGGVTDVTHKPVMVRDVNGVERPHPGYYWLAYDAKNLLPACILCNQPRGKRPFLRGKWNRFPVDGAYATEPGEENSESPLLVHPFRDIPEHHMRFEPLGTIVPLSDRGRVTLEVLDLNRDTLVQARLDTYWSVRALFAAYYAAALASSPDAPTLLQSLKGYLDGSKAYSAIGRVALIDEDQRLTKARAGLFAV